MSPNIYEGETSMVMSPNILEVMSFILSSNSFRPRPKSKDKIGHVYIAAADLTC